MTKLEMPRLENMDGQADAQEITNDPDFNPFREKPAKGKTEPETPDEEEPGEEEAPEETEEEEAPEKPEADTGKDPVYEIPEIGQVRASEILEIVNAAVNLDAERAQLDEQRAELERSYENLAPAMHVLDLLGHERIRNGFRDLILEVFKDADHLAPSDGKGGEFLKSMGTGQRAPDTQMAERLNELERGNAARAQDEIRRDLAEEFPGVVTKDFFEQVKATARRMYAGGAAEFFTNDHLREIARQMAQAASATHKPKPNGTQRRGTEQPVRLVATHSTRKSTTQPRLKDPRKMSEQEMLHEFVHDSGSFVEEE